MDLIYMLIKSISPIISKLITLFNKPGSEINQSNANSPGSVNVGSDINNSTFTIDQSSHSIETQNNYETKSSTNIKVFDEALEFSPEGLRVSFYVANEGNNVVHIRYYSFLRNDVLISGNSSESLKIEPQDSHYFSLSINHMSGINIQYIWNGGDFGDLFPGSNFSIEILDGLRKEHKFPVNFDD